MLFAVRWRDWYLSLCHSQPTYTTSYAWSLCFMMRLSLRNVAFNTCRVATATAWKCRMRVVSTEILSHMFKSTSHFHSAVRIRVYTCVFICYSISHSRVLQSSRSSGTHAVIFVCVGTLDSGLVDFSMKAETISVQATGYPLHGLAVMWRIMDYWR